MMPLFCDMRHDMRKATPGLEDLFLQVDYADDSMEGGSAHAVLKALHAEMAWRSGSGSILILAK